MIVRTKIFLYSMLSLLSIILLLIAFQTNPVTTNEDRAVIHQLFQSYNIRPKKEESFEAQIKQILLTQQTVLDLSSQGFPNKMTHLAKGAASLFKQKNGVCFDNSYVMEQMFKELGYEYRHVFWLFMRKDKHCLSALMSKQSRSHAAVEVKTEKGWLYVETLTKFIGTDQENNVHSATSLNRPYWITSAKFPSVSTPAYIDKKACVIYGLYSRNGKLFPPEIPIPDYNIQQLLYNFISD